MRQIEAATEEDIQYKEALVKEAVAALSHLDKEEQAKAFDYFQSLIKFYKNDSAPRN